VTAARSFAAATRVRAEEAIVDIRFRSSVIFVEDVGASRSFYEGLLCQAVAMDHGQNVGFAGGFAIWERDHAWGVIHGRPPERDREVQEEVELYFEADDLTAVADQLAGAGVPFVHPLREQPWGQRVLRVRDPDGYVVEIGEPMSAVVQRFLNQGLTLSEVAARTSMPFDVVSQVARQED
jgi:catechol 2,3-dioxygenase-like lactoylglutathione lyase family enzyme